MSAQASSSTRARDIDRVQTCGLLDAGYSEGQLNTSEYDTRTAAAMTAKTLGELDALVSDLQIPAHLAETAVRSATTSRRSNRLPVIVAVAAAVVATGVVFVVTRGDGDTPTRTDSAGEVVAAVEETAPAPPPVPGEPDSIVIDPIDTTTADGIEEFLRQFRAKFGDLTVDNLYLAQHHASFERMVPDQPHRVQDWNFYSGFAPSGSSTSRSDDATVDLGQLDIAPLRVLLGDAPSTVGLPAARIDYIVVRPQPITAEPEIGVYVKDPDLHTGYLYSTFDGRVTYTSTASGEG